MKIENISIGKNPPSDINVVIEIPAGVSPVKYEVDKESGAVFVDRFLSTAMYYPCNYGFIPNTLGGDGDPLDVLVVAPFAVAPGSVMRARPVGVLIMEDEAGQDEKIIAVAHDKLTTLYKDVGEYTDLPYQLIDQIKHFFEHYKDLEKGKWVKVVGWENKATAESLILEGIKAGRA
jgi:inorganic pyrophosphatase